MKTMGTMNAEEQRRKEDYMYGAISQRSFQRMGTNKSNEEKRGDEIRTSSYAAPYSGGFYFRWSSL
jgi:hypothetical protein